MKEMKKTTWSKQQTVNDWYYSFNRILNEKFYFYVCVEITNRRENDKINKHKFKQFFFLSLAKK
jgi:hypothetical protein